MMNLHNSIKRVTNYKKMKIVLKKWMQSMLSDLEQLIKKHPKRIYLEMRR